MKKLLAIILAVSMVFSMMLINVSAFEAESVESVDESSIPFEDEQETTASLADSALTYGDYGVLLFDLDFDTGGTLAGGNVSSLTTKQTTLPAQFTGSYTANNNFTGDVTTDINGVTWSDGAAVIKGTNYSRFVITASNDYPDGVYTYVMDAAKSSTSSDNPYIESIVNQTQLGTPQPLTTTMTTYTHNIILDNGTAYTYQNGAVKGKSDGTGIPTITDKTMGTYFNGRYDTSKSQDDIVYLDNYKVYWKPLTVSATVTANGTTQTVAVPSYGFTANDVASKVGAGSVSGMIIDGKFYGASAGYVTASDVAVTLIDDAYFKTENPEKGILLAYISFDVDDMTLSEFTAMSTSPAVPGTNYKDIGAVLNTSILKSADNLTAFNGTLFRCQKFDTRNIKDVSFWLVLISLTFRIISSLLTLL